MTRSHGVAAVNLGGKIAGFLFAATLVGFVVETQVTQYVQTTLGYHQPYFIFYTVHSSFTIIFPAHFLYLILTSKHSPNAIWRGLMFALKTHISPSPSELSSPIFPKWRLLRLVLCLTGGITIPGLLWFIAVAYSPLTDVTALWNTNAFFTYVVTVKLFKLQWETRRLCAVLLATAGAMAVIFGGTTSSSSPEPPQSPETAVSATSLPISTKHTSALFGDLLTLVAAIVYALYQVLYKIYAALPTDPDAELEGLDAPVNSLYEPILEDGDGDLHVNPPVHDMVYPPPFALYPNMLTSAIGICTFIILWIPIPIIHNTGIRAFYPPPDIKTWSAIAGIAASGVLFNAGFMILLGVWGPILTSIGGLLTIVLVFISDIIFGGAVETITVWSLTGCTAIVGAFGILVYDMMKRS